MDFIINKTVFSEALSSVCSVVSERSSRPILQNLMLSGNEDNTITLSGTDLELGLKITVDVMNMNEPGQVLLPATRLNALVKGTYSDEMTISITDNRAEIKTKYGRFQIPGQDTIDYPTIPDFKSEGAFFLHGDDFVNAVQKTFFATAKGDTRYALNGIYMTVKGESCEFVSSDSHRLSLVKKTIQNPGDSTYDGIIISKGMNTLARVAAGCDKLEINITPNEMEARTPNVVMIIRRLEGVFPSYSTVIPPPSEVYFSVKREELLHGLNSIGLLSSDESKSVLFSMVDGILSLSASSENGEGNIKIDAEIVGGNSEIQFNYTFLIEMLKNIGEDRVTVQYVDSDHPARIDCGDFTHIIMPINR